MSDARRPVPPAPASEPEPSGSVKQIACEWIRLREQTRRSIRELDPNAAAPLELRPPPAEPLHALDGFAQAVQTHSMSLGRSCRVLRHAGETPEAVASERLAQQVALAVEGLARTQAAMEGDPAQGAGSETWAMSVRLTRERLEEALQQAGYEPFRSEGEPYSTRFHYLLGRRASDTVAQDHIAEEQQRGYWSPATQRVLLRAEVIVSSGPQGQNQ